MTSSWLSRFPYDWSSLEIIHHSPVVSPKVVHGICPNVKGNKQQAYTYNRIELPKIISLRSHGMQFGGALKNLVFDLCWMDSRYTIWPSITPQNIQNGKYDARSLVVRLAYEWYSISPTQVNEPRGDFRNTCTPVKWPWDIKNVQCSGSHRTHTNHFMGYCSRSLLILFPPRGPIVVVTTSPLSLTSQKTRDLCRHVNIVCCSLQKNGHINDNC